MRTNTVLQERHLIEAVRQQVITHDQMEGILAIARSAARAEGAAAPDLRWIGYLQGAIVAIASLGVAAWNNDHVWSTSPDELFVRALVATAVFGGLGLALWRFRWAEVPASLLLTGAAMQTWGLGASLYQFARGRPVSEDWTRFNEGYSPSLRMWGFVMVALVSLAVWRWKRAAPALGMAAVSAIMAGLFAMEGASTMATSALVGVCSAGLIALTLVLDRRGRAGPDGGFWLSFVGLGGLGVCAIEVIDREPVWGVFFLALSVVVGGLGFYARRVTWLWAAGAALLGLPAFAVAEARLGDAAVGVVLILGAAFVAGMAHKLRRHMLTTWLEDPSRADEDRSIWA